MDVAFITRVTLMGTTRRERDGRSAEMMGTSFDRIATPQGQAWFVAVSHRLPSFRSLLTPA